MGARYKGAIGVSERFMVLESRYSFYPIACGAKLLRKGLTNYLVALHATLASTC